MPFGKCLTLKLINRYIYTTIVFYSFKFLTHYSKKAGPRFFVISFYVGKFAGHVFLTIA